MKILIAPDSFKESLSAQGVAQAIGRGFQAVFADAELVLLPVADGGEGTTQALVAATGGALFSAEVTGPMGETVKASWGTLGDGTTAVIESAAASGLDLVPMAQRNPWHATTRGTGELIMAALDAGARHIIVGLGGSATNDAGAGMLQALGVRLLDKEGNDIAAGGAGLQALHSIDASGMDPRLADTQFEIACDVDNPLTGEFGASAVFGPQKGADAQMVKQLDACLGRFAAVVLACHGKDIDATPGAGAAGGLGGAFLAFTQARLKSGIDIVMDAVEIDRHLEGTDLVITGEGRIDSQTVRGKTPVGVSKRAQRAGVPVIALAGSVSEDSDLVHAHGIDALFSIVPGVVTLPQALEEADSNLYRTARNIAATWKLAQAFEAKRR
uniref:glycerate kinase n=1 Tax=Marinobacterium profundum TaxID=1714300 RepID=UPI000830FEFC|nr:glycerate kinase [Marinobacterium profundum]